MPHIATNTNIRLGCWSLQLLRRDHTEILIPLRLKIVAICDLLNARAEQVILVVVIAVLVGSPGLVGQIRIS